MIPNHHPPHFSPEEAARLAKDLYGLQATARPLPGERDQNFKLITGADQAYILKIANAAEARAILDLQNRAIAHLAAKDGGILTPQLYPDLNGETIALVCDADEVTYPVRLLSYLPGKPLARVKPHSPDLMRDLGAFMGRVSRALADFSHPAARRDLKWDLQHAAKTINAYKSYLTGAGRRDLVEGFLARFEVGVAPILPALRMGVIHGDGNDYNILVQASGLNLKVSGLIDFGDMGHSYLVAEVAIAAAYAMLDKADPLSTAAHVLRGYHQTFPLTESELETLYSLICIRLCMSVCISAHQQQREPQNTYLSISEQPAWRLLKRLAGIHSDFAHYVFREACNLPPCPQTTRLAQWLRARQTAFASPVQPDVKRAVRHIFDLSVGSPEVAGPLAHLDTPTFTKRLFRQIEDARAELGVGRYNEARPIYSGDLFKVETDELPERRTIHLGIDLFQEAGSPVFAPLDGLVHSFGNNTAFHDYGPTIILQHTVEAEDLTFFTLYGHLSQESLHGLAAGKTVRKGQQIARLGHYPANGDWPPHLHFQIITDMLAYEGQFPGVAAPGRRAVWLSLSPDPNLILGIPEDELGESGLDNAKILAIRERHIGKSLSISYKKPLKIVRGYRQYLYDDQGRAYLDAVNNVPHVGHSHPRVVKAAQEQMAVLNTNTRYLHDYLARYAERLTAAFPDPLKVCFFVCSGSEANELALRLARTHTGQKDILVLDGAYHGNTSALVELSPYKFDGPGGSGAPPHVHKVTMPDGYRGPHKGFGPETGRAYAAYVRAAIEHVARQGRGVAAFIAESVLGCGGQVVLPQDYFKAAFAHVRQAGGLCIADEVQVGFGRVGSHFWAFETQQAAPDIVTLGKPIGNGHPLAAVITTPEIAASFNNGMEYFNTFGGNPVSCAIGMAVLDVIEAEGLQENALKVGNHLQGRLAALMDKYPLIGHVRGQGLFIGAELVLNRETLEPAPHHASYIAERMKDHGILISTDGPLHNVLKIKPPLVFNIENADFLAETLDKILAEDVLQIDA
jgi:4-aminobutyrate aminotransferase-like enzyme/Ser/Thr protein kinase RdoA (MazF antagonist)